LKEKIANSCFAVFRGYLCDEQIEVIAIGVVPIYRHGKVGTFQWYRRIEAVRPQYLGMGDIFDRWKGACQRCQQSKCQNRREPVERGHDREMWHFLSLEVEFRSCGKGLVNSQTDSLYMPRSPSVDLFSQAIYVTPQ
jgi:hypothetical protein